MNKNNTFAVLAAIVLVALSGCSISSQTSAPEGSADVEYVETADYNRFLTLYEDSIRKSIETGFTERVVEKLRVVFPGEKKKSSWTNSVLASSGNPIRITGKSKSSIELDQTNLNQNRLDLYIDLLTELEKPGHNPSESDVISAAWVSDNEFEIDMLLTSTLFTFENGQLVTVSTFLKEGFTESFKVRIVYEEDARNTQ
jgi:hypothetical protein